jgi:hypothetical protein
VQSGQGKTEHNEAALAHKNERKRASGKNEEEKPGAWQQPERKIIKSTKNGQGNE